VGDILFGGECIAHNTTPGEVGSEVGDALAAEEDVSHFPPPHYPG